MYKIRFRVIEPTVLTSNEATWTCWNIKMIKALTYLKKLNIENVHVNSPILFLIG